MSTLKEPAISFYLFDDVVVDCVNFRIEKGEQPKSITPRAFDVLLFLIKRRGRVIEKQELFDHVWGETFVSDNALTRAVKEIRRAIGDHADSPRYIETVPKRGYRFIAEVRVDERAFSKSETDASESTDDYDIDSQNIAAEKSLRPASAALFKPYNLVLTGAMISLAIIAVIALAIWKTGEDVIETAGVPRTTQITTWSGLDVFPALSPDGNSVAYSSDHDGSFEIYVKQLAPGGREIQITSDGENNFQPAWSPDGKMLAYYSMNRGGIWIVPALGGVAKRLSEFGSRPAWSPDGSLIAFQSEGLTDLGPTASTLPPSTIWVVPLRGDSPKQITQSDGPSGGHSAPAWSPDGKRIAFTAYDIGLSEIWSASSEGGDLKRLVSSLAMVYDPVYAPDGEVIYFSGTSKSKNFFLWKLPVSSETGEPAGEALEVANTNPLLIRQLTISADGKRLAYAGLAMENNIRSIPVSPDSGEATGPPTALTNDTSFRKSMPVFSPDAKKIAFVVRLTGNQSDIWLMDADGSNPAPLTTDPGSETFPNWFPEGDRLAFQAEREGQRGIWSVSIKGGTEIFIIEGSLKASFAKLSRDGKRLAFNSRKGGVINIWTAPLEGGSPTQLTFDRELMGFAYWSPDGESLAFEMKRSDDTHIAIMPSAGGTPEQLTFDPGQSWPGDWSPDGTRIVFAGYRNGVWNIWWVSRSDKTQKRLTDYSKPNIYVRYPDWSPKGDRIIYEYAETTGNIWMMDLK